MNWLQLDTFAHQTLGLYAVTAGSPTFTTATRRGSDPASLSIPASTVANNVQYDLNSLNSFTSWQGFAFMVTTLPTASQLLDLASIDVASGAVTAFLRISGSGTSFTITPRLSTSGTASSTLTTNTWYWLEMIFDTSGTTFSLNYRVGPIGGTITDQTGMTLAAQTSSRAQHFVLGNTSGTTTGYAALYSSWGMGTATSTTDWVGERVARAYSPAAVGVHNLDASPSTAFFTATGAPGTTAALTTAETTSYTFIDDIPLSGGTDGVRITGTPTTSQYAEWAFAQEATLTPSAVRTVVGYDNEQAGTSAMTVNLHSTAPADVAVVTTTTLASTVRAYARKMHTVVPGGAAWTRAALNALTLRFGYTATVAGIPRLESALLEMLAPNVTTVTIAPTSVVSSGAWTPTTGFTLSGAIGETSASDTDYDQSSASPATADAFKVRLSATSAPAAGAAHVVHYRYQKDQAAGDRIDLTVTLYKTDGTTVVASWTHTDIGSAVVQADQTLTAGQIATLAAGDYTGGLVLGFSAIKV